MKAHTKFCPRCKLVSKIDELSYCYSCYNIKHRVYVKKYRAKHKEQAKEYGKKYRAENSEEIKEKSKEFRDNNKEYFRLYRVSHKEHRKDYNKRFVGTHRDYMAKYQREKRKTDILFKLRVNLRARLNRAINRNTKVGSTVKDLGCSILELKFYLEDRFKEGMTWKNYGDWHIDHIIPLASFDLTDREQFLKACHYSNLQPLWASENISKGKRVA